MAHLLGAGTSRVEEIAYTTLRPFGNALVEDIILGVLHVEEDIVMLRGPALVRPRPIVVGPDDLVEERLSPEDAIQQGIVK